jgi:hypothetical protein
VLDQEREIEKPLRETHRPLKSLKTAKSGVFLAQGYQWLSKAHDFAGETFSFHFVSRQGLESYFGAALRAGAGGVAKNLGSFVKFPHRCSFGRLSL